MFNPQAHLRVDPWQRCAALSRSEPQTDL